MISSDDVFDHIEKIAATSSKLQKLALVKEGMQYGLFAMVVRYAYDPFKVYNVAAKTLDNLTLRPAATHLPFSGSTWELLDGLDRRTYTGYEAEGKIATEQSSLTSKSAELLRRILLKDLRAGFSESTINKAAPGTIPEFPYMRCSLPKHVDLDAWPWAGGVFSQEKADGMFANVNIDSHRNVNVTTRQGSPFPIGSLGDLERDLGIALRIDTQTHGELLVYENDVLLPREEGNGVLNSLLSGGELAPGQSVTFLCWDQIPLDQVKPKAKYSEWYAARLRQHLIEQVGGSRDRQDGVRVIDTKIVYSKDEAWAHYRELLKQGKEGTIISHPEGIWKDGTSKDKIKLKLEVPVELEVIGFNEGTGKYAGQLGSLQCASKCGKLRVDVSGRGDDMRARVWSERLDWLGAVITVKGNSIMAPEKEGDPHSLFLPIFLERRNDKIDADTLEEIQDQFRNAVEAA
jgi:DNA ligase-1